MPQNKPRLIGRVQFFAPYRQCEASLHASAMASFVLRKLKDVRAFKFQYLTRDSFSKYCSPFIDPNVYRVVTPSDFATHVQEKGVMYWFESAWDYFRAVRNDFIERKNHLLGNYANWQWEQMSTSKRYTSVIFPCQSIADRAATLTGCLEPARAIYPGSYRTLSPMRCDFIDRKRMAVVLSMCSIQKPANRLAILQHVENIVKNRPDVFITLLMDGHSYKEEKQYLEKFGLNYSDRCLIINDFSDYEYMNILTQNDIFIDLNPLNGVGYLLSAALHRGLLVCGFSQPLYRDILADGEYGALIGGERREFGYGWDHVIPNWDRTFKVLNEKVFNIRNVLSWLDKRNSNPNFLGVLEHRNKQFLGMFMYITTTSTKQGEFVRV